MEHPGNQLLNNHLKAVCDHVNEDTVVNPFKETGLEIITLDTGEVMHPVIGNCLVGAPNIVHKTVHRLCEEQNRNGNQLLV